MNGKTAIRKCSRLKCYIYCFCCIYYIYCSCCFTVFTIFTALAVLLFLLYLLLLLFLLFFPENRLRSALCFRAGFTQNPLPLCAGTGLFSWHPHRICGACTTNIPTFSVDFKSELQYLVKNFQRFSILFLDSFSFFSKKAWKMRKNSLYRPYQQGRGGKKASRRPCHKERQARGGKPLRPGLSACSVLFRYSFTGQDTCEGNL